ncbi:unnamed protein product [Rhizophagus irregularis]|nr:unnamed protein product [Rhizophagus irregularis]CAB4443391.1 unnamed protein product [Rhizophagus irregularis]
MGDVFIDFVKNNDNDYPDEKFEVDYPDEKFEVDYPDEKFEVGYPDEKFEIEVINCYRTKQHNNVFGKIVNYFKHKDEDSVEDLDEDLDENEDYEKDDNIKNEGYYQIAISQDGKFAATFDTGKKS